MKCLECGTADLTIAQIRQRAKYCKACKSKAQARARWRRVKDDPDRYAHARALARASDRKRYQNAERRAKQREYQKAWLERNPGAQRTLADLADRKIERMNRTAWDIPWRSCRQCGKRFIGRGAASRSRYCSLRCRPVGLASTPLYPRECEMCGVTFRPANQMQKVCSGRCRNRRHRALGWKGKRGRSAKYLRHMPAILERDNGRCGICGKRCRMDMAHTLGTPVPHPLAPTLDHLIPQSEGGGDNVENLQLAHFICNARLGVGGTKQLMLV